MQHRKILQALFMASYVSALSISFTDYQLVAMCLGAPALVCSGRAFFAQLLKFGDDIPAEGLSPQQSNRLWYLSLGELVLKAIIFCALLIVVYLYRV